jgi:hypothetical protein
VAGVAAYVTGAHSLKVGYQAAYEVTDSFGNFPLHGLQYRFNNGVPNQITQRITPWQQGTARDTTASTCRISGPRAG